MSNMERMADGLYGNHGTRKPPHYLKAYDEIFAGRRYQPLRILELGVSTGASLAVWAQELPAATIVGVDIIDRPALVPDLPRVHYVKGSQGDPETIAAASRLVGGQFDIIIDDASHIGYLTRQSFDLLFADHLVSGGVYVIEDCGASFIPEFPDAGPYPRESKIRDPRRFRSHDFGILGVVKQIVDEMFLAHSEGRRHVDRMNIYPHIAFLHKA